MRSRRRSSRPARPSAAAGTRCPRSAIAAAARTFASALEARAQVLHAGAQVALLLEDPKVMSVTPRLQQIAGPQARRQWAEPHEPCGRRSRVVPTRCRWAPCVRGHGPGQGQLPCGSYRPPGRSAPRRTPQPCLDVNLSRVRRKINERAQRAYRSPAWRAPTSAAQPFGSPSRQNVVQRIQGPGDAIACRRLRLFQLARPRLLALQRRAQDVALTLERDQPLAERTFGHGGSWACRALPDPAPRAFLGLALPA